MTDSDFLKFMGIILILQGLSSISTRVQLYRLEDKLQTIEKRLQPQNEQTLEQAGITTISHHTATTNTIEKAISNQLQKQ